MRISDDRYSRDMRRHNLAMRLIRHQARTETIRRCTELSAFRVRALFHAYGETEVNSRMVRHRGAAPRKLDFFCKSPRHEVEAIWLAICCHVEGVLPREAAAGAERLDFFGLDTGEKICDAFESFQYAFSEPVVTIEHAFLLAGALARGDELSLGKCAACGGLLIASQVAAPKKLCVFCRQDGSP